MKNLLIIPFIIFFSCSKHESEETVNSYDNVKQIDSSYRNQLEGISIEILFPDRCDRLTFHAQYSAFVSEQDLSGYEYNSGEFHRDLQRCLDDLNGDGKPDSKSEISLDGLIAKLHDFWSYQDFDGMVRLKDYGAKNNQKYGEGPNDLTRLSQIGILLADMLNERDLYNEDFNLVGTHNRHLLSLGFWLKLRIEGYLGSGEKLALENVKDNKLKEALLNRIDDGNQEKIIAYLNRFPDRLPLEVGHESWGGMPKWLYFFLVKAIIDGR